MFTGIVETLAEVIQLAPDHQGGRNLTVSLPFANELVLGESVALNGVCLTAVEKEGVQVRFQVGPETLKRSNLGELQPGSRINVERALRLADRLGGHLVSGHVDGQGRIARRIKEGEWETVWFDCAPDLTLVMIPKGSVAVDGVSLTLVDVKDSGFSVALIPHTLAHTTLGFKEPGHSVNLETDCFGKYVVKYLESLGRNLPGIPINP